MLDINWLTIGSFVLTLPLVAAEPGVKVQLVGGTVSGIAAKTNSHLDLTHADTLFFHLGKTELAIAYQKINTVEYGQNVKPQVCGGGVDFAPPVAEQIA